MKFNSDDHKQFYEKYGARYEGNDKSRQTLFYLLGISDTTRHNIKDIYDFEEKCIVPESLSAGWQTSSSSALTRLAFDLYHGDPVLSEDTADAERELMLYSTSNTLGRLNEWLPYAIEAILTLYM